MSGTATSPRHRDVVRLVAVFLGMMLYWPLLRRNALFYSVGGHDQDPWQAFGWYGLFLVGAVLCAGVLLLLGRRAEGLRVPTGPVACLFVVQAVCKAVETTVALPSSTATVVACADVLSYAAVFVTLTRLWMGGCIALEPRPMALVATSAFAVSFPLIDCLHQLPQTLLPVVLSCLPALSALCWWCAFGRAGSSKGAPATAFSEDLSTPAAEKPSIPVALLVVVGVFLVAGGVVRGLVYTTLAGGPFQGNPLQNAMTVLFAGLIFLYCALGGQRRRSFRLLWSLAAVLFFAGLLLMTGMDGSQFLIGGAIVIMGRTCLGLIYWIMLCDAARMRRDIPMELFSGCFVLVEVLSAFLGYIAIPVAMDQMGFSLRNQAGPLVAAVTFLLIITTILFFNRPRGDDAVASEEVPESSDGVATAVPPAPLNSAAAHQRLYTDCRLTEREVQVAELLAGGNSQKRIAEELNVSIGTVQSHVKNVYRKLDVHSRQELIDILHEER